MAGFINDAFVAGTQVSSNTATLAFTVTSGTSKLIIWGYNNGNDTFDVVQWTADGEDAQNATVVLQPIYSTICAMIAYLDNPIVGEGDIYVHMTGSSNRKIFAMGMGGLKEGYYDSDQTTSLNQSSSVLDDLTSGGFAVDIFSGGGGTFDLSSGSGQTDLYINNGGDRPAALSYMTAKGAITPDWTFGNPDLEGMHSGVSFESLAGGSQIIMVMSKVWESWKQRTKLPFPWEILPTQDPALMMEGLG